MFVITEVTFLISALLSIHFTIMMAEDIVLDTGVFFTYCRGSLYRVSTASYNLYYIFLEKTVSCHLEELFICNMMLITLIYYSEDICKI